MGSVSGEDGGSFFEERRDAFIAVMTGGQQRKRLPLRGNFAQCLRAQGIAVFGAMHRDQYQGAR
jgi:hypothetical protein